MKTSAICEELADLLAKEFSGEEADFVGGQSGADFRGRFHESIFFS
jgi:hypothetical protein